MSEPALPRSASSPLASAGHSPPHEANRSSIKGASKRGSGGGGSGGGGRRSSGADEELTALLHWMAVMIGRRVPSTVMELQDGVAFLAIVQTVCGCRVDVEQARHNAGSPQGIAYNYIMLQRALNDAGLARLGVPDVMSSLQQGDTAAIATLLTSLHQINSRHEAKAFPHRANPNPTTAGAAVAVPVVVMGKANRRKSSRSVVGDGGAGDAEGDKVEGKAEGKGEAMPKLKERKWSMSGIVLPLSSLPPTTPGAHPSTPRPSSSSPLSLSLSPSTKRPRSLSPSPAFASSSLPQLSMNPPAAHRPEDGSKSPRVSGLASARRRSTNSSPLGPPHAFARSRSLSLATGLLGEGKPPSPLATDKTSAQLPTTPRRSQHSLASIAEGEREAVHEKGEKGKEKGKEKDKGAKAKGASKEDKQKEGERAKGMRARRSSKENMFVRQVVARRRSLSTMGPSAMDVARRLEVLGSKQAAPERAHRGSLKPHASPNHQHTNNAHNNGGHGRSIKGGLGASGGKAKAKESAQQHREGSREAKQEDGQDKRKEKKAKEEREGKGGGAEKSKERDNGTERERSEERAKEGSNEGEEGEGEERRSMARSHTAPVAGDAQASLPRSPNAIRRRNSLLNMHGRSPSRPIADLQSDSPRLPSAPSPLSVSSVLLSAGSMEDGSKLFPHHVMVSVAAIMKDPSILHQFLDSPLVLEGVMLLMQAAKMFSSDEQLEEQLAHVRALADLPASSPLPSSPLLPPLSPLPSTPLPASPTPGERAPSNVSQSSVESALQVPSVSSSPLPPPLSPALPLPEPEALPGRRAELRTAVSAPEMGWEAAGSPPLPRANGKFDAGASGASLLIAEFDAEPGQSMRGNRSSRGELRGTGGQERRSRVGGGGGHCDAVEVLCTVPGCDPDAIQVCVGASERVVVGVDARQHYAALYEQATGFVNSFRRVHGSGPLSLTAREVVACFQYDDGKLVHVEADMSSGSLPAFVHAVEVKTAGQ